MNSHSYKINLETSHIDLSEYDLSSQKRYELFVKLGLISAPQPIVPDDAINRRWAMMNNGYQLVRIETQSKKPADSNWQNGVSETLLLTPHVQKLNTGIICKNVIAIDLDIDDPKVMQVVEGLICDHLEGRSGKLIVRTRASSFRKAYILAVDEECQKATIEIEHPSGPTLKPYKIEFLGAGQQLHVDGPHVVGESLTYENNVTPWNTERSELILFTKADINGLIDQLNSTVGSKNPGQHLPSGLGFERDKFNGPAVNAYNNDLGAGLQDGGWFNSLTPLQMSEVVRAMLDGLDNSVNDPREKWYKVLFAVADAGRLGCSDARELALEWSRKGASWTNERDFEATWSSYKPGKISIGSLVHMAEKASVDLSPWRDIFSKNISEKLNKQIFTVFNAPKKHGSLSISQIPLMPQKRQWIHGTDLVRGAVSLLVSPGGKGKSSWLIALALACASGRQLLGSHIFGGPLRVLYINAEDSSQELALRLRASMQHHQLCDADVSGLSIAGADNLKLNLIKMERNGPILDELGWSILSGELEKCRPDVVVMDPLVALTGGVTLNDNAAAALLMRRIVQIAASHKISFMIAHHTSKGRELGSADAAMGAASFVNLARISLAIEPISEKEAPNIGVSPWDSKSYFRITGTKQNLSPANNSDRLFRMISVEMDNAEPPVYLKGDSVGVAELFIPSSKLAPYSDQMLNSVLIQIKNANEPLSVSSNSSNHVGPTVLAAINPYRGGKANDNDVNAILSYLIKINYLSVVDVEVKRSGRGAYKRKAYELTALGLSRILQEKP